MDEKVTDEFGAIWPDVTRRDKDAVMGVLDARILTGPGPEVALLEFEWSKYVRSPHCVALNGGTSAIHAALAALGIGPGDEVIMPALSYCGTYQPVLVQGATPVFVDVDPRTYCMQVDGALDAFTDRTRAVIPVHLHGLLMPGIDELVVECRNRGAVVIEDACQAHGAEMPSDVAGALPKRAGTFGIAAAFSLNHTKTLVGGEGGLLVTWDDDVAAHARRFRYTGEDVDEPVLECCGVRPFTVTDIGLNYLMPEMTAALARSQLLRLDRYLALAKVNAALLTDVLEDISSPPAIYDGQHIYHKYRVVLSLDRLGAFHGTDVTALRDSLVAYLRSRHVPATLWGVKPLPDDPVFRKLGFAEWCAASGRFPVTRSILRNSIIIGDELHPLCVQDGSTVARWAEDVRSAWKDPMQWIGE